MRRRPRIDLSGSAPPQCQSATDKDEARLDRKRKRWAQVNKGRPPSENPFLSAIKPDHTNYGDPNESAEELRSRLECLEFGNYPGYFNYRNKATTGTITCATTINKKDNNAKDGCQQESADNTLECGLIDERLRLMKEEWFIGKSVLDVGCNRGHITYAIAKTFRPKFILGIDIDLRMIHMANRDLHLHLEKDLLKANTEFRVKRAFGLSECLTNGMPKDERVDRDVRIGAPHASSSDDKPVQQSNLYREDETHFTLSSYVAQGPLACCISEASKTDCDTTTSQDQPNPTRAASVKIERQETPVDVIASVFPNNILFVEHNYVLSRDELVDKQSPFFDTIICLSVTKWIHLNYRDDGLLRFFKRMYNHLNVNGLLILEAQPFDNYHRKKKLSDRLRANFNSIQLKPEQFDEVLLSDKVGFREIILSTKTEHDCEGFKRPMKVFLK